MYRHFIRKSLRQAAVFETICAVVLAFPASPPSPMSDLLDRFVTVTSLAEFRDREFNQSVDDIRRLLPLASVPEQSYAQLKDILLGVGLKAESEMVLRTGLEKFPDSRFLRVHLAEVLSGMGRSEEALGILEGASRLPRPDKLANATDSQQRATIFLHIGRILSVMSGWDDAVTAYRRAVEIAPEWSEARIELGRAYLADSRLEEARAEFERAVREAPDSNEAHLSMSEAYLAGGQWERAAAAAGRAIELGASDSRALYVRGTALIRMGKREEGEARLREFARVEASLQEVERRYREIDAISLEAIRTLRDGNGNRAIQQLLEGIMAHPDSSRLYMNLAMILSRMGEHQKAVETLESMLKRTKDRRFLIHKNLADEYRILGDAEASRRHRQIYLDTMEAEFFRYAAK